MGSAAELDTQLGLAARLGWLARDLAGSLAADLLEVRRMLASLRAALGRRAAADQKAT